MSIEGEKRCPLCTEEMDLTDQQLKPCKCGYEVCVWCWHHIMDMAEKDDTEGRCPACRTPYDKEKIVGLTANCERMVAINSVRKHKSQKAKPKTSEGRKHLSNVRVIQRNLVYIIGLPLSLADEDLLQCKEYFGLYGKILKVSISRTAGGAIQQFPNDTCSVYITYSKAEEAVRCIQSVYDFLLEGISLRASFGTTKYCHAWLRNMPCNNADCLYLHDIGAQEDSFTKDEVIAAHTRSRVQQIIGATNNMQRRSGNVLPPPVDENFNNGIASTGKSNVKSAPKILPTRFKGSPSDNPGEIFSLPAAASWDMRVSNCQPPGTSLVCLNGPAKQKLNPINDSLVLPSPVSSTTQATALPGDVGGKSTIAGESNYKMGSSESNKLCIGKDCPTTVSDVSAVVVQDAPLTTVTSSSHLTCLPSSKDKDGGIATPHNMTTAVGINRRSCGSGPAKDGNVAGDREILNLCSELSPVSIDKDNHLGAEYSDAILRKSSPSNHFPIELPKNHGLQQQYPGEQFREPFNLLAQRKAGTTRNGACVPREQSCLMLDSRTQVFQDARGEVGEDLRAFDDQRSRDSDILSQTAYLLRSSCPVKNSDHSGNHAWQCSETCSASDFNADHNTVHKPVEEASISFTCSNSVLTGGYNESKNQSAAQSDTIFSCANSFSSEEKVNHLRRLDDNVTNDDKSSALDTVESSIISNILSMDVDSCDDSLILPHNIAKFWNETDKLHGSFKISTSSKFHSSNQSRFSFARQEDIANQVTDLESPFSDIGNVPKKYSVPLDSTKNKEHYLDKPQKFFSSNSIEQSATCPIAFPLTSSNKNSVSRTRSLASPGFPVPSKVPPPGFSLYERTGQIFNGTSGSPLVETSNLPKNQYRTPSTGNISNSGDVEFFDPAILVVGKGKPLNGLNNPGFDRRPAYTPQPSATVNEARLWHLMQQSTSHQDPKFSESFMQQTTSACHETRFSNHIGDRFSTLDDFYGISSRRMDHSETYNLSPFGQSSLQKYRNGYISNGYQIGLNEVQSRNEVAMAELLRNERLGFNKFFPGYEELKYQMPNSGDIYSRAFGI